MHETDREGCQVSISGHWEEELAGKSLNQSANQATLVSLTAFSKAVFTGLARSSAALEATA